MAKRKGRQKAPIFISYSRRDRLAVDRLYEDLQERGYLLWMDVSADGIAAGEDWAKALREEMSAAECVIACLSHDFLQSSYCRDEIQQALDEHKPIYPLIVRPLAPGDDPASFRLERHQHVDLSQGPKAYEDGIERLLAVLPYPPLTAQLLLRRWRMAIAGLLLLALALVALALWQNNRPPPQAQNPSPPLSVADKHVGIVVTRFEPAADNVSAAEVAQLSDQFAALLEQEVNSAISPLRLTVGFLKPAQVGPLEGDPALLAQRYGAKIVIAGTVERGPDERLQLVPEFYIDATVYSEVSEITGISKFGSPIVIPDLDNTPGVQQVLSTRTNALTLMIVGLSYLVTDDYDKAIAAFDGAVQVPGLGITQGGQAVYMMLGSTHVVRAAQAAGLGQVESASSHFDAADAIYQQIVAANPEYARVYNGLAGVHYGRWNLSAQGAIPEDSSDLWLALASLDEAQQREDQPPYLYAQRALLLRVQSLYALWAHYSYELSEAEGGQFLRDLRRYARQIINAYQDSPSPALREVASEAYAYLGLAAYGEGAADVAIDDFEAALQLSSDDSRRMYFYGWLGDSYRALENTSRAREAYQSALNLAASLPGIDPALMQNFEERLDSL